MDGEHWEVRRGNMKDACGEDDNVLPDEADLQHLERLVLGFMASQVLFAGCELGLFDLLAGSALGAGPVSGRLGLSARGTQQLLDALVALRLLGATPGPEGEVTYTLTPLTRACLTREGCASQHHLLRYLGGTTYRLWAHLVEAVRSDDERLRFLSGLQDTWRDPRLTRKLLTAEDMAAFPRVCDLGGGSGELARAWALFYPASKVTVLETPQVVRDVMDKFPPHERVCFMPGDFFRDPLPPADMFILARVLHDWDDVTCTQLLGRVGGACGPGGAVLVVEALLPEDDDVGDDVVEGAWPARWAWPAVRTRLLSLNMLVQTHGTERSAAQYLALLAAAGFTRGRAHRTGGAYDVIVARK
ncbi:acetylserotonin O-methyltransferase [Ochotona princeps]|uniref:acetylserotonin O-methyltransferase n=1 Tax=Ochotona princeps TaxID=9978 RepID=UPI002714D464|nr:acetylserotonin O-methyltransferase [Ochotona princeps]